ncbi:hypothetical protein AHF37_11938 [Paragonimus kellicotti]|nr:hypothetical protein AHF37_11938 [Paragonimus kellicotti]
MFSFSFALFLFIIYSQLGTYWRRELIRTWPKTTELQRCIRLASTTVVKCARC